MITTKDQAKQFLTTLCYLSPAFHLEDDPKIIEDGNGNRVFNDVQCTYISDRLNEVYDILADPCAVMLRIIESEISK